MISEGGQKFRSCGSKSEYDAVAASASPVGRYPAHFLPIMTDDNIQDTCSVSGADDTQDECIITHLVLKETGIFDDVLCSACGEHTTHHRCRNPDPDGQYSYDKQTGTEIAKVRIHGVSFCHECMFGWSAKNPEADNTICGSCLENAKDTSLPTPSDQSDSASNPRPAALDVKKDTRCVLDHDSSSLALNNNVSRLRKDVEGMFVELGNHAGKAHRTTPEAFLYLHNILEADLIANFLKPNKDDSAADRSAPNGM